MPLTLASKAGSPIALHDTARTAVREGMIQALRGEFANDEDMEALFKRLT
jgi:predicted transcriptional regulator